MKTVVVSGAIANKHLNGGATWTRLSWALGLRKLGFRVFFVEHISRQACVDADGGPCTFAWSANMAYFRRVMSDFGLEDSSVLIYESGQQIHGASWDELVDVAKSADLLVNISGHLDLEPLKAPIRRKVYVDLDPGFTQLWHASGNKGPRLEGHDLYYTVGANVGGTDCTIPTGDIAWRPIRQPVLLDQWPVCRDGARNRFTTIASWRGAFGPLEHGGQSLGAKVREFRTFAELPRRAEIDATFEIALDIHPGDEKDLELLRRNGWNVVDPKSVAGDPHSFRQYVQNSGAEFSVAQGMYVHTRSGWFSDRTTRYLASGKPAVIQDTGHSAELTSEGGVLSFGTMEEAIAGVREVVRNYERHSAAARQLAERYFDSDKVLGRLVEEAGVSP